MGIKDKTCDGFSSACPDKWLMLHLSDMGALLTTLGFVPQASPAAGHGHSADMPEPPHLVPGEAPGPALGRSSSDVRKAAGSQRGGAGRPGEHSCLIVPKY